MLADTTPEALLAQHRRIGLECDHRSGHGTCSCRQAYQVSTMVNQMNGIMLRIVSATRPHEAAVVVDPSLEEAYLRAVGGQAIRV